MGAFDEEDKDESSGGLKQNTNLINIQSFM